jgi:hypothetical protein
MPGLTENVRSRTATVEPYRLVTLVSSINLSFLDRDAARRAPGAGRRAPDEKSSRL